MSDPTLTSPREMQVKRVAAAMDAERAFRLDEGEEVTFDVGQHPGGGNLPGGLTAQQEVIAARAIDTFVAGLLAEKPRTGVADISRHELDAYRDRALGLLKQGAPLPF